ncbi:MAG: hypothetical protein IID18_04710, partial [Nitrospinae bacterium]|nr:hypothetical protein [Nitrospinota bacterium]
MNLTQNRALEWASAELQPLVLGILVLMAVVRFLVLLRPKWQVLASAPSDDRFDKPLKRLIHTIRIAFLQVKLFKDAKAGWMHAFIFWGFLVLLVRAAEFFVIGFFPSVEMGLGRFDTLYGLFKDLFVVLVTLAASYALYRRLVLRPERLTLTAEGVVILVLILAIMISDALFDAAWLARNPQAVSAGIFIGPLLAPLLGTGSAGLHNLAYWMHVTCILYFLTLLPGSKHFH